MTRPGIGYWLWPVLLTLALTGAGLTRAPLWRDELATWSVASRSAVDLLRLTATIDGVNGPYYLLTHAWLRLAGDSVAALRMPAALAMTAAAGVTAALGATLFHPRVGLVAGLLFAVVPSTSRYGQEARPYALATLLAVVATLLLVRSLRCPTWRRWIGYAAALAWLGLLHLVAVSLVAGHAVAVGAAWWRRRDPRSLRWLPALLPAAGLVTPLALLGRAQQGRQLDWVDRPSLAELAGLPGAVAQAGAVGGLLVGLAVLAVAGYPRWTGWAGHPGCAGHPGLARAGRPVGDEWRWTLAAILLLPAALLFLGGLVSPLWVPRYLLFVVPFGCVLAATALVPSHPVPAHPATRAAPPLRAALPIVLLVALLGAADQMALRTTHEWPRSRPVDYPRAARIIAAHQRPGDGMVFSPRADWAFLDTAIAYHLRRNRPRDVLLARDPVGRADLFGTECAQPAECLAGVDRLWMLARGEREDPRAGVPGAKGSLLRTDFELIRSWPVDGLSLALLRRK